MKILFVVCGEGLGHASRSTKLAAYLKRFGHRCFFASYGKAYEFILKQGNFPVFSLSGEVTLAGNNGLFNLAKTLWLSKTVPLSLLCSYRDTRRILRENSFDLLVSDTMYAAGLAAKSSGVPCVFITNQNTFAPAENPHAACWKILSGIVQRYLHRVPEKVIVPDFAPPNTISGYNFAISAEDRYRYCFTGPISDREHLDMAITDETIFASFGGEPFKLPFYTLLRDISEEMPNRYFEVFSMTPGLPQSTGNFQAHGYVPDILPYLAKARVAILHGGLTSLQEALFYGKPVVMIIDPHHPEQWNNARKLEEMQAGIVIRGDAVTKELLEDAISRVLQMSPPDMQQLFYEENGRETIRLILEEIDNRRKGTASYLRSC